MKNRTVRIRKNVYRSMGEFERAFLPEKYKARTSREPTDDRSLGIYLANELIEAIRSHPKPKAD
jgi:hypothetical protein